VLISVCICLADISRHEGLGDETPKQCSGSCATWRRHRLWVCTTAIGFFAINSAGARIRSLGTSGVGSPGCLSFAVLFFSSELNRREGDFLLLGEKQRNLSTRPSCTRTCGMEVAVGLVQGLRWTYIPMKCVQPAFSQQRESRLQLPCR